MLISRRTALLGTAAVASLAAPVAMAEWRAAPDPLLDLEEAWHRQRHYACYEQPGETDKERDPAFEDLYEIEKRIIRTNARSPAGIAVKLRLWAHCALADPANTEDMSLDEGIVTSALRDAERLSGRAVS